MIACLLNLISKKRKQERTKGEEIDERKIKDNINNTYEPDALVGVKVRGVSHPDESHGRLSGDFT